LSMLTGSLVAIVTPMFDDGRIDYDSLKSLLDWHIASGTAGIVIVGTTGESPTVSFDEHFKLIETTVKHVNKRIAVIAGTGGNSTAEAIELQSHAKKVGADAGLSVVPYYNKPTQEGLYQHFKKIAESVDLPVILYNVPGRTVADLSNDTTVRLSHVPGITGLKDATGDMPRFAELLKRVPANFAVYSGNDDSALALMLLGGHGVISVVANVAPKQCAEMCAAAFKGDLARARLLNNHMISLQAKLFVEANPAPVKWALKEMGKTPGGIRLPLVALSPQHHDTIRKALAEAGAA
jgi:4-hydroxy-tetrahydrodipicolinate synthase